MVDYKILPKVMMQEKYIEYVETSLARVKSGELSIMESIDEIDLLKFWEWVEAETGITMNTNTNIDIDSLGSWWVEQKHKDNIWRSLKPSNQE